MRPELLAGLRAVMRGDPSRKMPVTPVTPVTDLSGYGSKPLELQALQRLRVKNSKGENDAFSPVTLPVPATLEIDDAEIGERAAFCAECVPPIYLDAWERLNHRKPMRVSEAEWRRALDDGGHFLDTWGALAAEWGWTAGELFDLPRPGQRGGLIWFIEGTKVEAFGPDYAGLDDGRIFDRGTVGGEYVNYGA